MTFAYHEYILYALALCSVAKSTATCMCDAFWTTCSMLVPRRKKGSTPVLLVVVIGKPRGAAVAHLRVPIYKILGK